MIETTRVYIRATVVREAAAAGPGDIATRNPGSWAKAVDNQVIVNR